MSQDNNKVGAGTELTVSDGAGERKIKISSVGGLIDKALDAIERDNPRLRGSLHIGQ